MWIICAVVYAVVCSAAVLQQTHHFELIELAIRCAILLPALVYAVRSKLAGNTSATAWTPPPWRMVAIPFAIAAAIVSFTLSRGILEPDESAYRFQARIFASGHLMAAPLPGAAEDVRQTPPALYYEHHILNTRGWMTKYYPGWPIALVPFAALNLDWLLNPLLSLLLLGLTYTIARCWFDERTGRYAVLLLALSPFFLMLSVGSLSDMFCSVLVAAAWLGLARLGGPRPSLAFLVLSLICIMAACLTRPFTGLIVGVCFTFALVALLRSNRRLLSRSISIGADFAVLTCVLFLGYNYAVTGNAFKSPYAASKGIAAPTEISLRPGDIYTALTEHARPALQSTIVNVFPFLFLLAGWEVWRRRRDPQVWAIAPLFPALIAFHLLMPEPIAIHNGERYYAEGLFAVAILAAAAINRRAPSRYIAFTFIAIQIIALAVSTPALYKLAEPYIIVRQAIDHLPAAPPLVFLKTAPGYSPFWLNMNNADWKHAPTIYLIDPGNEAAREKFAAQFGRSKYIAITYDAATHTAR